MNMGIFIKVPTTNAYVSSPKASFRITFHVRQLHIRLSVVQKMIIFECTYVIGERKMQSIYLYIKLHL
jgi:hypothetical protein